MRRIFLRIAGASLVGLCAAASQVSAQAAGTPTLPGELRAQVRASVLVADSLVAAGALEEAYEVLQARLDVAPDDFAARLLAVKAALALGIMGNRAPLRLHWLRVAAGEGRLLLDLRPEDPEAMAWAAAALGRVALAEDGMRTVVRLAEEVWALTGRLLEVAPDHALGNHVRGKMNQEAMRLSAVKRFMGRLLLGFDLPAQASWAQAEAHLTKAVALDPGMVLFYLDLGDTYRFQGKDAEAAAVYERALTLPDRLPVDAHLKGILRRRLQRLQGG